ncbi:uncharacterized protein [Ptychodera flava]|uniref:uncharacterized protein n=1 Tax=Ptychodera flava TaxID=63121 RepID=UPI00396A5CC3
MKMMILWLFVAASIVSAAWGDCSVNVNQECTLSFQDVNLTELEARLRIVENMKFSDPPTWAEGKDHGNLGSYTAGSPISVYVEAKDSEGGEVTYKKISGSFPAGVTLDAKTGKISGVAPYIDASFSFIIRASNEHGRCADALFTMDIRGMNLCSDDDDCLNGGNCTGEDDGLTTKFANALYPWGRSL